MKHDIGLVLSGGGIRGAAHIGMIRALEENGIKPSVISGSSAGSIVGALYAAGYGHTDMLRFFQSNRSVFYWWALSSRKPGLFNIAKYRDLLKEWFPEDSFDSLHKELFIAATDVLNAHGVIFSEGSLTTCILASAALPVVFTPVEIDGNWYVDGGVMNNFPLEPVEERCAFSIGSYVSSVSPIGRKDLKNSIKLLQRVNELGIFAASRAKFERCDFVFHPRSLFRYGVFDTKKIEEIYEIGYVFALEQMEYLLPLLPKADPPPPTSSSLGFPMN